MTGTVILHVFLPFSLISYFFVNCLDLFLFLRGTLGISLVDVLIKKSNNSCFKGDRSVWYLWSNFIILLLTVQFKIAKAYKIIFTVTITMV